MGRAMIIICAAVLISLGITNLSASNQGGLLTRRAVKYNNEITAKNAAHTAIQMAMQKINGDPNWIKNHGPDHPWINSDLNGAETTLYIDTLNSVYGNGYWEEDSLRMISEAVYSEDVNGEPYKATVTSVYLKQPFSTLVPAFTGALQLPTGYGQLNVDGEAHGINGIDSDCGESKPPITVASEETKNELDAEDINMDGEIAVDTTLNYEPTDELIARLENSGNATYVTGDWSGPLGSPEEPGVFFVDGEVTLSGGQKEGYGIMVVKNEAYMDYLDPDSTNNTLTIRGNFEFHGLVIFENANAFDSGGTPDIYGSVLIGDTNPDDATETGLTIKGNAGINYSCQGENYAKMAASNTVSQHKYTRVVTYEDIGGS